MIKNILKLVADSFCTLLIIPLLIVQYVFDFTVGGDRFFWSASQLLSLIPGLTGSYIRKNYYALAMTSCSREGAILFNTIFSHKDTEIGKKVYIGPGCNIGKCKIDNHCTIGSGVHILSGNSQHGHDDIETPIQQQPGVYKKITIGEDTWIGNCAVILASIGEKCIVGAGSVVTKDIEDYSIIAGNPAKIIKRRQ